MPTIEYEVDRSPGLIKSLKKIFSTPNPKRNPHIAPKNIEGANIPPGHPLLNVMLVAKGFKIRIPNAIQRVYSDDKAF